MRTSEFLPYLKFVHSCKSGPLILLPCCGLCKATYYGLDCGVRLGIMQCGRWLKTFDRNVLHQKFVICHGWVGRMCWWVSTVMCTVMKSKIRSILYSIYITLHRTYVVQWFFLPKCCSTNRPSEFTDVACKTAWLVPYFLVHLQTILRYTEYSTKLLYLRIHGVIYQPFFWVIPRRLNFICCRFGTLSLPSSLAGRYEVWMDLRKAGVFIREKVWLKNSQSW